MVAYPYYSEVCSHHTGNLSALYDVAHLKAILSCIDIEPEGMRLERISAVKAPRLVQVIADCTEEIRRLDSSQPRKKGGKDG